jgi:hypothetical protein
MKADVTDFMRDDEDKHRAVVGPCVPKGLVRRSQRENVCRKSAKTRFGERTATRLKRLSGCCNIRQQHLQVLLSKRDGNVERGELA